jgi:hypothetical protein
VQVGPPIEIRAGPGDVRRIVPILGGTVDGAGMSGQVLPGGADWQVIRHDGTVELDARYLLQIGTGAIVAVRNVGLRHAPGEHQRALLAGRSVDPRVVYFRTSARFETAAPDLAWLTRSVFIGDGERHPADVIVRFWRVE